MSCDKESVTYEMIREARRKCARYVARTPLVRAERLEELFSGAQIYLKLENLQHTGSFKVRGVANKMLSLAEGGGDPLRGVATVKDGSGLSRGVAAASSGNHAQAVAWMAARLGVKSVIIMPEDAPSAKIDGTKKYGAEVVLCGRTVQERERKCDELIEKYGYALVHSYADALIIAGHGTAAVEAAEQTRRVAGADFDEFVVPCGAGAIVSGSAVAVRNCVPGAVVTAVEPAAVPRFTASLRENRPVSVEMGDTVADGLRVARTDSLNFSLIRDNNVRILTIGEAPIRRAVREILLRAGVLAEPSAGVGVAAALEGMIDTRPGRRICFLITGGNMDAAALAEIVGEYGDDR